MSLQRWLNIHFYKEIELLPEIEKRYMAVNVSEGVSPIKMFVH